MGFFDVLFGEGPSSETQTLDTLTPEQQQALNQLLSDLRGSSPTFDGDVSVEQSELSQLSLAGLEERAIALSNPNRTNELATSAADTLLKFLDFEGQDAGINDFFNTNVRDPALADFQENILPAISRDFGGANFFSTERQGADAKAQGNLIESLTRGRSSLAFNSRESDRNRSIEALGLSPAIDALQRGDTQELLQILQAGETTTALSERNVGREFERFLGNEGVAANRRDQLLGGVNTTAIENIVTTNEGSSGLLGPLLGAASNPIGSFLSNFLDKDKGSTKVTGGGTKNTRRTTPSRVS